MSTARNGAVEIYYEEFGDPEAPTLLLVNGLGSQCLNYDVSWCQLFCDEGFHVVRFDNRDVGLSTKCDGAIGRTRSSTWPTTPSPSSMPWASRRRTSWAAPWAA